MTDQELNKAIQEIWKDACNKALDLVKSQKFRVFDSNYALHRFVKHKDSSGEIKTGADILFYFINKDRRPQLVIATPEAIENEKRKCRKDAETECKRQIQYAKKLILENESLLADILSDKKNINYDI